jgi:hypothetical protein
MAVVLFKSYQVLKNDEPKAPIDLTNVKKQTVLPPTPPKKRPTGGKASGSKVRKRQKPVIMASLP